MALDATKRLNFQKYLYPGETGLQTEQNWHRTKRVDHSRYDHIPGIVNGMKVVATAPASLSVNVGTGRAVDAYGFPVVVSAQQTVDLSSYATAGATVYIVAYENTDGIGSDPYVIPETGSSQNKYLGDYAIVGVQLAVPSVNMIELARIVITAGAGSVANAADPLNPGNNEINLLNRDIFKPRQDVGSPPGWKVLDSSNGNVEDQLAELGVTAGDQFWCRPGSYTVGQNITLPGGVKIAGLRSAIFQMSTYKITTGGSGDVFEGITLRSTGASAANPVLEILHSSVVVRGVLIDKTGSNDRIAGITLGAGSAYVLIEGCEIEKVASDNANAAQILADGGSGGICCKIVNCKITIDESGANTEYGVKAETVGTDSPGLLVQGCDFVIGGSTPVLKIGVLPGPRWIVTGCNFDGANDGYQQGVHVSTTEAVVSNCVFKDMVTSTGTIRITGADCTCINNKITSNSASSGNYIGISTTSNNTMVVGNSVYIRTTAGEDHIGISAGGDRSVYNDNIVDVESGAAGTAVGIACVGLLFSTVDGNYIRADSGGTVGISVDTNCSNFTIHGNSIATESPAGAYTEYGIELNGPDHVNISDNNLRGGTCDDRTAIRVTAASDDCTFSGNVCEVYLIGIGFYADSSRLSITSNHLFSVNDDYSMYLHDNIDVTATVTGNVFRNDGGGAGGVTLSVTGPATLTGMRCLNFNDDTDDRAM
jgi:hypothetical protein